MISGLSSNVRSTSCVDARDSGFSLVGQIFIYLFIQLVYNTSCHPVVLCVYILSSVGFSSCLHWYTHLRPDSALGVPSRSVLNVLLMFWCDTEYKDDFVRMNLVHIGVTPDQLLDERLLMDIKFDSE